MDSKFIKPNLFSADPNSSQAGKEWKHWYRTFTNFLESFPAEPAITDANKLRCLIAHIDKDVYDYVSECETYEEAVDILGRLYVKPCNVIFARHLLMICKQQPEQSLDDYLQKLKQLAKDCNYRAVNADICRNEAIRDAFISGLQSTAIRSRLLENTSEESMTLQAIFNQARSLDIAHKSSERYNITSHSVLDTNVSVSATVSNKEDFEEPMESLEACTIQRIKKKCDYCGNDMHSSFQCPAKRSKCYKCGNYGHFAKQCRSKTKQTNSLSILDVAVLNSDVGARDKVNVRITIDGVSANALIDTGSTLSHINKNFAFKHKFRRCNEYNEIGLAISGSGSQSEGYCLSTIQLKKRCYPDMKLLILSNLLTDVILGQDFLKLHNQVLIEFGGPQSSLIIGALECIKTDIVPHLFEHLSSDCKPITTKSRKHSVTNEKFIAETVRNDLQNGIIEPSTSPWRAQVLVTTGENHRKRMCIDYSETINKFTLLDGYPLPNIQNLVNKVAQYSHFSTLDLKSAYHQVEIPTEDRPYTAFEANGKLYQSKRLSFGLTNAVPWFQRIIDNIIEVNKCEATFVYLDNITVCGKTKQEHDINLQRFLDVAAKHNFTFNKNKCVYSSECICLLGYQIENGSLRPDPERVQSLLKMPVPTTKKELRRSIGLFAYYARWLPRYSDRIKPLVDTVTFPLNENAVNCFRQLQNELANATLKAIDYAIPFSLETDASNVALSAVLHQNGRPVAFWSRTLTSNEKRYASIEKEAAAIVESIRKWSHFLLPQKFTIVTDQNSVRFMFDKIHRNKIKNDKIMRWRIELSQYCYDIVYREGKFNVVPDALSRVYCASTTVNALYRIHADLCHPGVTRMYHYVRIRNLPYSLNDVKRMIEGCTICSEIKPRFYKPPQGTLIKCSQPFERLSLDFKGPLPSATKNHYFLTVVDEFSRFPFIFPCSDISSRTVILCLNSLFSLFGFPAIVHSDNAKCFVSKEIKLFLDERGIASTHSSVYNPRGNSQCERFNGTIWNTIKLALRTRGLKITKWETVIPEALHSLRSLLCTATNEIPHDRFLKFSRRSMFGTRASLWITEPGSVYVRKHVRDKYDPLVDEVELLNANQNHAVVRYPEGREVTISTRDIAPKATSSNQSDVDNSPVPDSSHERESSNPCLETSDDTLHSNVDLQTPLNWRSTRQRKPPERFNTSDFV